MLTKLRRNCKERSRKGWGGDGSALDVPQERSWLGLDVGMVAAGGGSEKAVECRGPVFVLCGRLFRVAHHPPSPCTEKVLDRLFQELRLVS